jgi:Leucine-rich repeat (LRR) protein
MPYNNQKFQQLISQIRDGNFDFDRIELPRAGLEDEHFGTLIAAINSNIELKHRLVILDLKFNSFQDLSAFEITDFPALQVVSLQGGAVRLKLMPKISNCPELYHIDLSCNNLEYLSLNNLKRLSFLFLQNNSFKENPRIEFEDCPALQQLNLENNGMEKFTLYKSYLKISKLYMSAGNKLDIDTVNGLKIQRNNALMYTKTPAANWDAYLPPKYSERSESKVENTNIVQCCFQ